MKKIIAILAVVALILVALPVSALAHGHGSNSTRSPSYSICTKEDCNITCAHKHEGLYYAGHSLNDGHEHHVVCSVRDCTKTATHTHDGSTYFGHHTEDGHTYHNSRGSHASRHGGGRHH